MWLLIIYFSTRPVFTSLSVILQIKTKRENALFEDSNAAMQIVLHSDQTCMNWICKICTVDVTSSRAIFDWKLIYNWVARI